MQYLFGISMFVISLFLILLILIQRGRGGGLAGAFGGMGGQSAFGTKAGDLFTRITIGVAAVWILLSVAAIKVLNQSQSLFGQSSTTSSAFSDGKTSGDVTKPAGNTGLTDSPATSVPAPPGTAEVKSAEVKPEVKAEAEPAAPKTTTTTPAPEKK